MAASNPTFAPVSHSQATAVIDHLYDVIVARGGRDTRQNGIGNGLTLPHGVQTPQAANTTIPQAVKWDLDVSFLSSEEFETWYKMIQDLTQLYEDPRMSNESEQPQKERATEFSAKVQRSKLNPAGTQRKLTNPSAGGRKLRTARLTLTQPPPDYMQEIELTAPNVAIALSLMDPDGFLLPAVVFIWKNCDTSFDSKCSFKCYAKFSHRFFTIINDGPLTLDMIQPFLVSNDNFWIGNLTNLVEDKAKEANGWVHSDDERLRRLTDTNFSDPTDANLLSDLPKKLLYSDRNKVIAFAYMMLYGPDQADKQLKLDRDANLQDIPAFLMGGQRAELSATQIQALVEKVWLMFSNEVFTFIQKGVVALVGKFGIRKFKEMGREKRMQVYRAAFRIAPALMTTAMFGSLAQYLNVADIFSQSADGVVDLTDDRCMFQEYLSSLFTQMCELTMTKVVFGLMFKEVPGAFRVELVELSQRQMGRSFPEWNRLSYKDMPVSDNVAVPTQFESV